MIEITTSQCRRHDTITREDEDEDEDEVHSVVS